MGMIFPLSWPAKIALIFIALFLGLIWSMFQWPQWWHAKLGKRIEEKEKKQAERVEKMRGEKNG